MGSGARGTVVQTFAASLTVAALLLPVPMRAGAAAAGPGWGTAHRRSGAQSGSQPVSQAAAPAKKNGAAAAQFTNATDIGTLLHAGTSRYDAAGSTFHLTAGGENVWGTADDFRFVYKQVDSEAVSISAHIAFEGGGAEHRKALLMVRQSLDANSPYVDVAVHGNGLTSLQYRDSPGGATHEIEISDHAPERVALVRRESSVYLLADRGDGRGLQFSGAAMNVPFQGPVYVGLGLSAHDKIGEASAAFSRVEMNESVPQPGTLMHSTLEVVPIGSTDRRVVMTGTTHVEAPNWLRDNSGFLMNAEGHLIRVPANIASQAQFPAATGKPELINTGGETHLTPEHGVSPDGSTVAFTDSGEGKVPLIYTVPLAGGDKPLRITAEGPSNWHGWSPDGKTIVYSSRGERNLNIYTVPATGGHEMRLTHADAEETGPEYSPDGKWIYFNSDQSGHQQIWRMHPDGSAQQQVTHDETNDWFPHISPDGKWMVYLAYVAGVNGDPPGQNVTLQLRSMADGATTLLARFWGGHGSIDSPSWSPDSTRVAFVSYADVPKP